MRTIDPTLKAALAAGQGDVIARAYVKREGFDEQTMQVISYKLTGTTCEIKAERTPTYYNYFDRFRLERGLLLGEDEYTLSTGYFFITHQETDVKFITITGEIFPPKFHLQAGGLTTYTELLEDLVITTVNKSFHPRTPGDPFWSYQFFPAGRLLTLNRASLIMPLIRQKYFLFACDDGYDPLESNFGAIRVYYAPHWNNPEDDNEVVDFDPVPRPTIDSTLISTRLLWRDESNSTNYQGAATNSIHNLGFIHSTASEPQAAGSPALSCWPNRNQTGVLPINLEAQDGDVISAEGTQLIYSALVTEILDNRKQPAWYLEIAENQFLANTEGGAMPSTIEAAAPYTPLNVSHFDAILSAADNNIQAAMETLDDHTHASASNVTRILPADLTLADGDCLILTQYLDTNTFNLTLQGDAALHIL